MCCGICMIPSKFSMESGGAPPDDASAVYAGGWSLYLDMVKVMWWHLSRGSSESP